MIKTIYQFGEQLKEIDAMKHFFEISGSPYPEKNENESVIFLEIANGKPQKLTIEDYRKSWKEKYLFRELAAKRSTSLVPTLHFYNLPVGDKTENLEKNRQALRESVIKFLDKLERCLDANISIYKIFFSKEEVISFLDTHFQSFIEQTCPEKKNYLFTIKIDDKWIGEVEKIRNILEEEAYNKYFNSKGDLYKSNDKICSVTYQQSDEVWGRVDTLGFTVNDISFSRNGFDAKNSYKMFPVSPEVVKTLEGTQRALSNGLSYGFQNLRFYVLPRFIAINDNDLKKEIVETFIQKRQSGNTTYSENQINSIINSEGIFNEIISEEKLHHNSVYYDIFFYEEKQAQFSIKLHLSDLLPSRFGSILNIKSTIADYYNSFTKITTKKDEFRFNLTFSEIKRYFPEPLFFQVMEAIFYKTEIGEYKVLAVFMELLRTDFKNVSNDGFAFPLNVKRSFVIHQYLQNLQIFGNMETQEKQTLSYVAEEFVNNHESFFKDTPAKEAAFYLGCATEILLNAQESHLKSRPFAHKLNNLNIGYREMMEIKPKLLQKLDEYEKADKLYGDYDAALKLLIAFDKAFINIKPAQNNVETSYAFSLGLTIQKESLKSRMLDRIEAKKIK
ncbi:TM1802 family CRISPR-associated protein [Arcicella sp. LKC2W]|uniref:TM1802 family CRISPR-associated protein n=1 Tax=Arcicella sp. LKC2W TaxID=2984198 RepID=UPI002B2012CC|nr:TM1802 family CRISPR-associated protein [Arcicella sp. LKC2W]MEA5458741.1 TM1802 family CRISPR-associated protein [Arcicella sp. LKC2W]